MKSYLFIPSVLFAGLLSLSAFSQEQFAERFFCQGLPANFPGYCSMQALSVPGANWIECFNLYDYPNGMPGAAQACDEAVNNYQDTINRRGLCLCELRSDFSAELRKWLAGDSSYTVLKRFPRVEPANQTPSSFWGEAMDRCKEVLTTAKQNGDCPN